MSERSPEVRNYVEDLLQACEHVQQFTAAATENDFNANVMMQYSVIRGIEVLGEASKQLMEALPDATSRFPALPLKEMYAARNRLIHGYSSIKLETVWNIVIHRVPLVRASARTILANWPSDLA